MRFFRLLNRFEFDWHPQRRTKRQKLAQAPRQSKNWQKSVGAIEELEFRQTVTDAIVPIATGMQAAGMLGAISAGDALRATLSQPSLIEIAPSRQTVPSTGVELNRAGWNGSVPPGNDAASTVRSPTGVSAADDESVERAWSFRSASSPRSASDTSASDIASDALFFPLASDLGTGNLSLTPQSHGEIRKLRLPSLLPAFGASTTFSSSTADAVPQENANFDVPRPESFTSAPTAPPVKPFIPTPQPTNPSKQAQSPTAATPQSPARGLVDASVAASTLSPNTSLTGDKSSAEEPSSSPETGSPSQSSASGGGFQIDPVPKCADGILGGGLGQSGGTTGQPPSAPDTSSDDCSSSSAAWSSSEPLFVLNWHDGLVMAPDVVEYDPAAGSVELRAQVYGKTVSSYSWDTSQASRAGCVTGSNTYKLKFRWATMSNAETTEQITVTATMTDSTTRQQTLTFKVAAGTGSGCPGSGGSSFPTTTWPAVLTPDKPLESQDVIASDSMTRPYAVSEESGVLYVGHTLPAYNPGMPALGLTYSSAAAERRPIFVGRYELDPAAAVPNTVSARLQFDGSWGSSKYYDTSSTTTTYNPGDIVKISLQADAGSLSTGRYDYTFETTANYSGGSSTTTSSSGGVTVINEESSVFGEGWTLDILDRLHAVTGGVILNQGAGNSLWFAVSGGSYVTPAGDFSTLVQNQDNSYTRTLKDGTLQNFDSSGYQTSLVDRNSNRVTFTYDGSNNLSTITDQNSLVTTFSYSGSCGASNHVCTITDPANRVTSFSYTGSGRLEKVVDPDVATFTFTYDSGSGRMATFVDPRSNTTSISYDFAGRVTTVTRSDSTTDAVMALQLKSLCDSGQCTSGSPGTPLLSAEAVADYTDPRSNAWDTRLDWYGLGSSTQVTDPLGQSDPAGHMTVIHRDSNACATQTTDRLSRNIGFTLDSKCNVTKITFPGVTTGQATNYECPTRRNSVHFVTGNR